MVNIELHRSFFNEELDYLLVPDSAARKIKHDGYPTLTIYLIL
jgi:hypothetical protein